MNHTPISQDSINAAVWTACDTFRGTVDPSIYKDYVLTMLFLKYVSDVWQDHYDNTRSNTATIPDLIEELLKNERFVLPPTASFYALHAARFEPGNGERIDKALHAIEDANIAKLRDVVPGHQLQLQQARRRSAEERHPAPPAGRLRQAGVEPAPSRVGKLDVIGNAYEFLIKHFASTSGKKAGEFYTPPEVSQLIARTGGPEGGRRDLRSRLWLRLAADEVRPADPRTARLDASMRSTARRPTAAPGRWPR